MDVFCYGEHWKSLLEENSTHGCLVCAIQVLFLTYFFHISEISQFHWGCCLKSFWTEMFIPCNLHENKAKRCKKQAVMLGSHQATQGRGGVTIPGGVQEPCGCGTGPHG